MKNGLGGAHVPHRVLGDEVKEKVAALVSHVQELVSWALDSVNLHRHDVAEDPLHMSLLLRVSPEAQVRLEVTSAVVSAFLLLEGRDVSRRRRCLLYSVVIEVEQARLDGADVGAGRVSALARERLVNDSEEGASLDGHANHVRDLVDVALSEGLRAVDWVDPHGQVTRLKFLSVGTRTELHQ